MPETKITPEIAAQVCNELAINKKSLREICESLGFTHGAFLQRVADNEELANQYTRAMNIRTDADFEGLEDELKEKPLRTETGAVDSAWVNLKRLQIDTRKWVISRRRPKKYGDKIEQTFNGRMTLEQLVCGDVITDKALGAGNEEAPAEGEGSDESVSE